MRIRLCLATLSVTAIALGMPGLQAQQAAEAVHAQIDRIFKDRVYETPRFGPARWLTDGTAYTVVERTGGNSQIARYDAATGARTVLATVKLDIDDYAWSDDGRRLLIFTNTKRVWRQNTRGDYWVLDVPDGTPRKIGGAAPES